MSAPAMLEDLPPELCPACAIRDVADPHTGFCIPCAGRSLAENYTARE